MIRIHKPPKFAGTHVPGREEGDERALGEMIGSGANEVKDLKAAQRVGNSTEVSGGPIGVAVEAQSATIYIE